MSKVFGHGDLRLYLLHLLEGAPRHGYEVIRLLEDRFLGVYTPSAGTVYPRLAAMEDDGLVSHDSSDGRKVYRLTDKGRDELEARRAEIDALHEKVATSARDLVSEIRAEVQASVRELRGEIRDAAREVQREQRRAMQDQRRAVTQQRRSSRQRTVAETKELQEHWRQLRVDLSAFVTDVLTAARRHRLDVDRMRLVQSSLLDARTSVLDALAGHRRAPGDD